MPIHPARLLLPSFVLASLLGNGPVSAQSFTKITSGNPIATMGGGATQYGGASWIDADGDGDLEFFLNGVGLFRNDGGTFVFLAGPISSPAQGATLGNTWADVDNDGDLDVFLSGGAGVGSSLYLNQGALTFTKVTTGAIGNSAANLAWGCAFADYDRDGFADVVTAAAYSFNGIFNTNRLFHNNGDGTFTSITSTPITQTLAPFTIPTWCDYDDDGDDDLFIGAGPADGSIARDYLYRNRLESAPGTFERINTPPLGSDLQDGQVYHWMDYDNDGDLDVYLTNFRGTTVGMVNRLYRNDAGTFVSMSAAAVGAIVSHADFSLGNVWEDFDNDGDLDAVVANGGSGTTRYYRNNGNGTFTSLTVANLTTTGPRYGAAAGDYDDDGRVDLYLVGNATTAALLQNTTVNANHWVKVRLVGVISNRAALGARVRLKATIGGVPRWQMRELNAQDSFNGMSALEAHFGIGAATSAESLVVEWPSGIRTEMAGPAADQRVTVVEDFATPVSASLASAHFAGGRVALRWQVPGEAGRELVVERTAEAGGWAAIGRAIVDGTELLEFTDESPVAGMRNGYRLAEPGASGQGFAEAWVEVPGGAMFGIASLARAGAGVRVAFGLASREPGRIELLDVSGRRVAAESLDAPEPGTLVRTLSPARALAGGVYFVRLVQGERQDVRRVALFE